MTGPPSDLRWHEFVDEGTSFHSASASVNSSYDLPQHQRQGGERRPHTSGYTFKIKTHYTATQLKCVLVLKVDSNFEGN